MLFESTRLASGKVITKQKLQYPVRILEFLVGAPLATREHAHILFAVIADCLYILSSEVAFVNYFFHGFSLFLSFSIFLRFTAIKALSITAKDPKTFSVLRSFWSW